MVANYYTLKVKGVVGGCICCCGDNHPEFEQIHIESIHPHDYPNWMPRPLVGGIPQVAPKVVDYAPKSAKYVWNPRIKATNR